MPPSWLPGAEGALGLEEVIERLGGRALMERMRVERPVNERYPDSVERLRMLVQASAGETLAEHIDDMLRRVALSSSEGAETDPNRLNLLTLHSTKGLEFSRVYVVGVENQVLPAGGRYRRTGTTRSRRPVACSTWG